jgi:hypothetical protein
VCEVPKSEEELLGTLFGVEFMDIGIPVDPQNVFIYLYWVGGTLCGIYKSSYNTYLNLPLLPPLPLVP